MPDVLQRLLPELTVDRHGDADATSRSPRVAEIELAPADLGRLRLLLQTTDRGLTLSVAVERPDMVEVVRRHLDGLHRALMAEGLALDGFDIGTEARQRQPAQEGHRQSQDAAPESEAGAPSVDEAPPPPRRRPMPLPGRLDLSL
ncbi:flagellar hook-length control protein FliK [Jannaschia marina]|uniref:flagellar hook-length control protein FliK n=1 Tax=Jannaschia marina TaxID=2741674 RepID=UPI0015C8A009|nr:flagellar hook-length control protein FliK [Jannaschia marina]